MAGLAMVDRVARGELPFGEFARLARSDFYRLAAFVARREPLPTGVEIDDVAQVLLDRFWHYIPRWDPKRGQEASKFVKYNAVNRTRRWIRFQRSRQDAMNHANYERDDSEERGNAWESWHATPATQEAQIDFEQRAAEYARTCETTRGRVFAAALIEAGYDVARAARTVYADPDLRFRCRLGSDGEALSVARAYARQMLTL